MDAMDKILLVVLAVLGVAAANVIGPRIRVAPPLILVVVGAVIGIMPFVPAFSIDPQWILVGVLPPLLYSAAVSFPAMDFRRDFRAISALSVVLVLISSVALGFLFTLLIPGLSLAAGVALGAIVSPTDAVATNIAARLGVPNRVIAVLRGESMLNDATSLVLLRTAIAAAGTSVAFGGVALNFMWSVFIAVVVGALIGALNIWVRSRVADATVNTAISFTVPYLAYLPVEELHGSGLVAAVTAGLVSGSAAVKYLPPQHRASDALNWRTVELIAEGGVFLLMGLELWGLIVDVHNDHDGVQRAVWTGAVALLAALAIRAAYVTPLVWWTDVLARRRGDQVRSHLEDFTAYLVERQNQPLPPDRRRRGRFSLWWRRVRRRVLRRRPGPEGISPETARIATNRITRRIADIDYYASAPIGPRESTILVWAGMRGVVTVAAAQTLPAETPSRSLLVLVAFVVAAISLLVQGGTIGWLVRMLGVAESPADLRAEHERLHAQLIGTAREVIVSSDALQRFPVLAARLGDLERAGTGDLDNGEQAVNTDRLDAVDSGVVGAGETTRATSDLDARRAYQDVRREIIDAQRQTLLYFRDEGSFSSELLSRELSQLDAEQISLDMRIAGNFDD